MATVSDDLAIISTSNNGESYETGLFTPTAGDLLVVFAALTGTEAAGSCSSSDGISFTKIGHYVHNTSADRLYGYVANELAAAVEQSVTATCTGDAATGAVVVVVGISGMVNTGISAVRQYSGQDNQDDSVPAPEFASAALTENCCLGCIGYTADPAVVTAPAGWTEIYESSHGLPDGGLSLDAIDSGCTDTTVTWGAKTAAPYASFIVEMAVAAVGRMEPKLYGTW